MNIDKITDSFVTIGLDNGGVFSSKEYRGSSIADRIKLISSQIELWEDDIEQKSQEIVCLKEFGATKSMAWIFSYKQMQDLTTNDKISLINLDIDQKREHISELKIELKYLTQKYL